MAQFEYEKEGNKMGHSVSSNSVLGANVLISASTCKPLKPGFLIVTLHEATSLQSASALRVPTDGARRPFSPDHISFLSSSSTRLGLDGCALSDTVDRQATSTTSALIGRNTSRRCKCYAVIEFEKALAIAHAVDGSLNDLLWAGNNVQFKFDVSRVAELTINVYMSHCDDKPVEATLLGSCSMIPRFEDSSALQTTTSIRNSTSAGKHNESEHFGVRWVDLRHSMGQLKVGIEYVESLANKIDIEDFEVLRVVGRGAFATVMQVCKKDTNRVYALKTLSKRLLIGNKKAPHAMSERNILAQISNPFIVPLKFAFQSPEKLYLVMAFVIGGELLSLLRKQPHSRFKIAQATFYTAEIVCALDFLHKFNVIHRDLKLENILLDHQGHVVLCDFGTCKLNMKDRDRTSTMCGTPSYFAPERMLEVRYNETVDWWALGVVLYGMLTGELLFRGDEDELKRSILRGPSQFPDYITPEAKDLLHKLLERKPERRLGAEGAQEVKAHPIFQDIDWLELVQRKSKPPLVPMVRDAHDTSNFGNEFTSAETVQELSVEENTLNPAQQALFYGYNYNQPMARVKPLPW